MSNALAQKYAALKEDEQKVFDECKALIASLKDEKKAIIVLAALAAPLGRELNRFGSVRAAAIAASQRTALTVGPSKKGNKGEKTTPNTVAGASSAKAKATDTERYKKWTVEEGKAIVTAHKEMKDAMPANPSPEQRKALKEASSKVRAAYAAFHSSD